MGYFVSVFFVINIYTNRWNFVPPKKVVFYITTLTVAIYIIPSFFVRNFHALGFTVDEAVRCRDNCVEVGKYESKQSCVRT